MRKLLLLLTILLMPVCAFGFFGSNGGGAGSGDITSVLSDASGAVSVLYQTSVAFSDGDTDPDVSAGSVFRTANTGATTIADFDGTPADGHILFVIVDDANTTFDFTSSGLLGNGGKDYVAKNGDLLLCVYDNDGDWNVIIGNGGGLNDSWFSDIFVSDGATGAGGITLYEDTDDGANFIRLLAPNVAGSDVTLTLPTTDGNNAEVLTTNGSGVLSWTSAGGATAYDDISDPDAASTIAFDDTETITWQSAQDTAGSVFTIDDTDTDVGNNVYLLELQHSDDGDTDADFLKCVDNNTDVKLTIQENGNLSTVGTIEGATLTEGSVAVHNNDEMDASSELADIIDDETGTGLIVFNNTPTLVTPVLGAATVTSLAFGSDPADAGTIMLENADSITFEADAAGTDVVALSVDSSEVVQIASSGASGVTITPALTLTAGITIGGDITTTGGAYDVDVVDNNAAALSFDATGKEGILRVDSTDSSEGVTMSGTLDVTGAITENSQAVISETDMDASSELADIMDDETGTGKLMFATSPTITTNINIPKITWTDADASPSATGEMLYDNTVTGIDDGWFTWYDDDEIQYFLSSPNIPSVDGTLLAYNATNDELEWVAAGAGNVADNTAEAISGVWEIQDDTEFNFGNDANWSIEYDEDPDDQLLIHTANTTAVADTDPMIEILVDTGNANGTGMDADQQVFGIAKGNQANNVALFTVDEDGDVIATATITSAGETITANDPTITLDESDGTDWQVRVDDTGNSLEIGSSSGGVGDNVELEIDEDGDIHVAGDIYLSGGNINTGATSLGVGDATTTAITLLTDSTGDAEVVLPNDSIGDAEIAFDEVTGADLTLTDAGAITGTAITAGRDGTDGTFVLYSEQGATDYTLTFQADNSMTGNITYTFPAGNGSSGQVLHNNGSGVLTWEADDGAITRQNEVGDSNGDGEIVLGGYETTWTSTLDEAAHNVFLIDHTDADVTAATTILQIQSVDDAPANLTYIDIVDNTGVSANPVFTVGANGATTINGAAEGTDALTIDAGDITVTDGDLTLTAGDAVFGEDVTINGFLDVNEDITIDLDAADEEIDIDQTSATGTEDIPLFSIDDDRTGDTATELSESTVWIDAEGVYAIGVVDGKISAEGGYDIGTTAVIDSSGNYVKAEGIDSDAYIDGSIDAAHLNTTQNWSGLTITFPDTWNLNVLDDVTGSAIWETEESGDGGDYFHLAGAEDDDTGNQSMLITAFAGSVPYLRLGGDYDDTDYVKVAYGGAMTFEGTADIDLPADSVDEADMSANSVDSDSYVDGSIDIEHLADDVIDADAMADADHGDVAWSSGVAEVQEITISDDESTDDAHEVVFTTNNAALESDGDFTYNPNSGTVAATQFVGGGTGITGIDDITPVDTGDEDATFYPILVDGATGTQVVETDGELTYNPNSGTLTATEFSGGGASLTGVDAATGDSATDFFDAGEIADARIVDTITASNYLPLAGGTVTGTVLFSDNSDIELDATADGMDDDEYNGVVIGGRNCGESLSQWDLVELVDDADPWHKADATAASGEYPAFGLSVAACTDTNEARILVKGIVRNEGWTGLTVAGPVYLGETDGALTQTAPSDSNDCVQIVGWALSDSEIYFDFSRPYQLVE